MKEGEMQKLAWIENLDGRRRVLALVTVECRLGEELGRGQVQGLEWNTSRRVRCAHRHSHDRRLRRKGWHTFLHFGSELGVEEAVRLLDSLENGSIS